MNFEKMHFEVKSLDRGAKVDIAIVPIFKKQNVNDLSKTEQEIYRLAGEKDDFEASTGDVLPLWNFNKDKFTDVLVVGLGDVKNFTPLELRWAFSKVSEKLKRNNFYSIYSFKRSEFDEIDKQAQNLWKRCVIEGLASGLYFYNKYKTEDKTTYSMPKTFYFAGDEKKTDWIKYTKVLIESTNFAKDLVNEPSNALTPQDVKDVALKLKKDGVVDVKILDKKEMEREGLNGSLAVSGASSTEPCVIKLFYNSSNAVDKIGIIGKCLTFDSGGLAIKPQNGMDEMKTDMAGAAAVLGLFYGLARLQPKLKSAVTGYISACENLLDSKNMRPGDIIRYLNGKSVEIVNPDAEGRLTLADMLCLSERDGCKKIIDIATLTGACEIALGDFISGIMGNSDRLINDLIKSSKISSELLWQLPLPYFYRKKLKSIIADLSNVGGRAGGAITAGIFLKEFVSDKVEWAHIDIAGKAFYKEPYFYNTKGATGMGVKTLFEYLLAYEC